MLYLVNASEAPEDAGYLAPEMAVLEWIGKPVIVLLNQTGRPRPRDEEEAEESRWRNALGRRPLVRAVVSLDAFARCWVQEIALLRVVGQCCSRNEARRLRKTRASVAGPAARAVRRSDGRAGRSDRARRLR